MTSTSIAMALLEQGEFRHLLTGSRIYGEPGEKSDLDLVLLMTPEERDVFVEVSKPCRDEESGTYADGSTSFRFGGLNLIVCTTKEAMAAWMVGSLACLKEAPVRRERAIELHRAARMDAGVPLEGQASS